LIRTFGFGIFFGNDRLSINLQTAIADEATELWLSPISIWETLLLAEKGRIFLEPNPVDWVKNSLQQLETREAPSCHEIAMLSRQIELDYQDPGDRLLAPTNNPVKLVGMVVDAAYLVAG
jgi:PIN domain nuclease of toxin-antitoxin system